MTHNRTFRYLAASILAFFLLYSTKANAISPATSGAHTTSSHVTPHIAVQTAVMAATMPHSPGKSAPPAPPGAVQVQQSATCFWRVPGVQVDINLYMVYKAGVYGERTGEYRTRLVYGNTYDEIPIKAGDDTSIHLNMIAKRLQECKEGK